MLRNSWILKLWNDVRWILETGVWVHWQTIPAGLMSRSSPDDIWQLWNFKQMQKLSWHNLSLKTVVVHNSVTSLMMKTNLQKGGPVHRVPCAKSGEKLQEFFQSVYVLFCNINTITYFNSFEATRYVCNDQSVEFYSLILFEFYSSPFHLHTERSS